MCVSEMLLTKVTGITEIIHSEITCVKGDTFYFSVFIWELVRLAKWKYPQAVDEGGFSQRELGYLHGHGS